MDSDRYFRTTSSNSTSTTSSNELFICFTSRFSSSSMKISSKSILSPNRTRPESSQISLSSSLSRRLKSSNSLKCASPMFPTNGKKRCNFENPEPSSPKVTCIGQVRVKTKKQGKKIRARSMKRRGNSEVSFRKSEVSVEVQGVNNGGNGQQKWVHLPFTICEAVRAFGAELNCFLPCYSEKGSKLERERVQERERESSCGAVFARWLVSVEDGDGKGREIELMVGDEEIRTENESRRRHVFEGMDFKEKIEVLEEEDEVSESRIGICIPPKNALLLMRCRSDPVKVAELAKRFCESPKVDEEDEEQKASDKEEEEQVELNVKLKDNEEESVFHDEGKEKVEELDEVNLVSLSPEESTEKETNVQLQQEPITVNQNLEEPVKEEEEEEEENEQELTEETIAITIEDSEKLEVAEEDENKKLHHGNESEPETEENQEKEQSQEEEGSSNNGEKDERLENKPTSPSLSIHTEQNEEAETEENGKTTEITGDSSTEEKEEKETGQSKSKEIERESSVLPDCLLLMMYEPKLSMEVSKETWVCSTDFIRCVPTKEKKITIAGKMNGQDPPKKRVSKAAAYEPKLQPPRWSCSAAAHGGGSMATMIEQKLVKAAAYEPFVLTRCKSEPMRTSAQLAPDACWKERKLEPHGSATFGVGAAGVGF